MRIIFMGTPEFAVASLAALLEAGEEVVAVVTGPDRPAGRGQKLSQSAVKQFAVEKGIPVLQPEKLKDPEFVEQLRQYKADLQIVVAFRMLPEIIWNMPPKGTVNLHASLLPQYRGAAPINQAIMNGETETGVTTFLLQHEIDTGNVLFAEKVAIGPTDTAGVLHDKLMKTGAELITKTVRALAEGNVTPIPQEDLGTTNLHAAPKIFKEDCLIDWNHPTDKVYNHIRGLSPYPAAFTYLHNKVLKIYAAEKELATDHQALPTAGTPLSDGKTHLKFATVDGFIQAVEVQLEGKRRMQVGEFLRGYQWVNE